MASKKKVNLTDFDVSVTLGTGSFGRVKLAREKKSGEYCALKILKKHDIIKLKQVDHVISENTILIDIDHPFLVRSFFNAIGRTQRLLSRRALFVFSA